VDPGQLALAEVALVTKAYWRPVAPGNLVSALAGSVADVGVEHVDELLLGEEASEVGAKKYDSNRSVERGHENTMWD
jgi:hypothetical protein